MELRDLAPVGIALVVAAIVLTVGADILATISATQTGTAQVITDNGTEGILELASWMPTIGLVVAAGLVIGIVVASFAFRR